MSLKDNMDFVKEELNSEEKFLESFVKIERFFKKYKLLIVSVIVIVVVALIALSVNSYLKEQNKIKANIVFQELLKNPSDKKALDSLKSLNPNLYDIVLFNQKSDKKDVKINAQFFKQLLAYENAMKEQNVSKLNDLSMDGDFLLKELAIYNRALILTNQGKYKEAKDALNLIPKTSQVKDLVTLLNHYLITK
jgi:tetratricopeptide (TPR) repeat protein